MSIAFWCVLIAGLLPLVWQGFAKALIFKTYDNSKPREVLSTAQGAARRASWAHDNSWEAFAPFAAAVIIGHVSRLDPGLLDGLALTFIAARVAYGVAYITDQSILRSFVWTVGMLCVVFIYFAVAAGF